jgi:predicted nucleic acid-binding protein
MRDADRLQFVDTNVLIYAHDQSAGEKHKRAKQLLAELWENQTGCLSIQILQEFYVNVTQKIARPLKPDVASQIISDLAVWQIHQPGVGDVLDAMMLASAAALGCKIVWSEDLNPGQPYDQVIVSNPFAPAT